MAPPLKQETALQILQIVRRLKSQASFGNILLEANRQGTLAWHRTLRRYLDLLVKAEILNVKQRNVGSVNPQQLYSQTGSQAHLWTGLKAVQIHGLNWDVPDRELHRMASDLEAMLKAKIHRITGSERLVASLEDTLIHELKRDLSRQTGSTEFLVAMLATKPVDLPYMLRRADSQQVGQTVRQLFKKIIEAFTSLPGDVEGRTFLEARTHFLKILHHYNSRGFLKLIETPSRGKEGLTIVQALSSDQIVSATAKQLGVTG